MGRTGVWGHNMINMTIRELLYCTTLSRTFPILEFLFMKDIRPWRTDFGPEGKLWGKNKKQRSCDGRGGAQRPVSRVK
jgi:hypothetical protein